MTAVCKIGYRIMGTPRAACERGRRSILAGDERTDSKKGLHFCGVLKSGRIWRGNNSERVNWEGEFIE